MCSSCEAMMLTVTNFAADSLFLVLLSPAQPLSLCTMSLLGAVCHSNMIPVSRHLLTYLATRLTLCQSLALGLDMTWSIFSQRAACLACPPPSSSAYPQRFCANLPCLRSVHHAPMPFHFGCKKPASTPTSILVCSHHQRFRSL